MLEEKGDSVKINKLLFLFLGISILISNLVFADTNYKIFGKVIDKSTGNPLHKAIVYIGVGSLGLPRVYTNKNGNYQINLSSRGQYGISAFKKGYDRTRVKHIDITSEKTEINFEMAKLKAPLQSIRLTGRIIEQITDEGTRSENHFVKIEISPEKSLFIFDEIGNNELARFKKWLGKEVHIEGYKGIGRIGWRWSEVQGIYVEDIKTVQ